MFGSFIKHFSTIQHNSDETSGSLLLSSYLTPIELESLFQVFPDDQDGSNLPDQVMLAFSVSLICTSIFL